MATDVPLTITLDGDPLEGDEIYDVEIESRSGMGQETIMERGESGTQVIVSAEELSRLPIGPAVIRVSRIRSASPQAGHTDVGGRIETRYEVGEIEIQLVVSQPVG